MYYRLAKELVVSAVAAVVLSSYAADRTISANYTLTADETVDGVLTVASGVTVDLNGHNLTVKGLAGGGKILYGATDLTSPDPNGERVSWTTSVGAQDALNGGSPINLFNNNYVRNGTVNSQRILVAVSKLPLAVTYDFGENTPQRVDMYKVYCGPYNSNQYNGRSPKVWTLEGSNDKTAWTTLDSRNSETGWPSTQETRTYTFDNAATYRYYRITFKASSVNDWLECVQLEYFDTSAVPETPAELHVVVPEGTSVTNATVAIDGSVRLVKEGAGEFVAMMPNQMYSGGTRIAAGTLKAVSSIDRHLGVEDSIIQIDAGATYDFNGANSAYIYRFVMNGGTLTNTGANFNDGNAQIGNMTLIADSYLISEKALGFRMANDALVPVDLGGHVFDVTHNNTFWVINANFTNGTVRVAGPGGGIVFRKKPSYAATASFDLAVAIGLYDDAVVKNLTLRSATTGSTVNTATGEFKVLGTFKTETANFPFVKMMAGSTLDLKAQAGTFDAVSTCINVNGYKVRFDAGATVTIDIAGRTPAIGDCLISWDEMPDNVTFQFDDATAAEGVSPIVTERGLFYGYVASAVEWAWWTNGVGDGDLTNPQNWICKNAGGEVVENALPTATTRVYLPASLDMQIPPDSTLVCGVCVISNCTLAADCDLRGLGSSLLIADGATVNLAGHRLDVTASQLLGNFTVKGDDVGHDADLTTTDATRVSSPTTFLREGMTAANLFNNNYARGTSDAMHRVIVERVKMPLIATYDFGEGQGKVVDAYRVWTGPISGYGKRLPLSWKFEGSDDGENWTLLDSRFAESEWGEANVHRTYTFANDTAYRRYRITIDAAQPNNDGYLELVQLEYFHLKPTQGELHIDTTGSSGAPELTGLVLAGNMRVFVEGNGSVRFTKTGQTYVGGIEICGGTCLAGIGTTSLLNTDIFGEKGSEVMVRGNGSGTASAESGVIDFGTRTNYTGYAYVLSGGTIQNSCDGTVTQLRLDADSYMKVTTAIGSGWKAGIGRAVSPSHADLGGHELSVTVASGRQFALFGATLENGSVYVKSGGWFAVTNNVVATNNVSIKVNCATDISGQLAVTDLTSFVNNANYNVGAGVIDIYGTFSTKYRFFHGILLRDGATIDLATDYASSDPLPTVALFAASTTGDKTMRFEPGAEIGIILGGRKIEKGVPIISWTEDTKPDATVKFVSRDVGRNIRYVAKEDGLYTEPNGLMIIVK